MNRGKRGPCKEIFGSPNFKSSWERNVYRILKNIGQVEYEPKRFSFNPPYYRCLDYCPDFFVFPYDRSLPLIVEVKGWLDSPSRTRLKGFKKYYPEEAKKMIVVTSSKKNKEWVKLNIDCEIWDYNALKKQALVWE